MAFNQFSGKGSIKSQNIIVGGNDFGNGSWDNYTRISFLGPKYNYQATTPNEKGELMARHIWIMNFKPMPKFHCL